MNKRINILSNWILAFAAIVFILFYLYLSFSDRVSDEDLVNLPIVQSKGFFEYLGWFYSNWSGRFASTIYFLLIMSGTKVFEHIHYFFFLYHCVTLLLLLYSLSSIIRIGIQNIFNVLLPIQTTLIYSILFVAGFYFSTFEHSQVWWWLCAATDSVQGITFLLLGTALIMKQKKNLFHYLLITISFIYASGCSEVYCMIVGFLFLSAFFYLFYVKELKFQELKKRFFFKGLITALYAYLISSAVSLFAPGNFVRRLIYVLDNPSNKNSFNNGSITIHPSIFFQKKYLLALALSALWMLIGMKLRQSTLNNNISFKLKRITEFLFVLIIVSFFITYSFQVFILVNYQVPLRGWTFTSFSLLCFFSFLFLSIGYYLSPKISLLRDFSFLIIPTFVLFSLSTYLYREYCTLHLYVNEYDKFITLLQETKKNKEIKVLYVNQLPDSGMLLPLEIEKKWITDPLKEIFHLNFDIKIKE